MHVIFGQDLEGCPLPESFLGLNRIVLGPRGFIDFLELRLGLPPTVTDNTARLLTFREALRTSSAEKKKFYSASFEVDPFGSSKVLLRWRDELCLNGWMPDSNTHKGASPRLRDMAAVENLFQKVGGDVPDDASRLVKIGEAIAAGGDPKIEKVDLLETLGHFPIRWRNVLKELAIHELSLPAQTAPIAPSGTKLHAMQAQLLGFDAEFDRDDESIRIVEGPVLSKNADAAAAWLSALEGDSKSKSCLISDTCELEPLDRAVRNLDLPSVGSGYQTSQGALVQLAPVLLQLHWGPFNPQAWLEFFLHPVRPVSPKLAGNLAFALNQYPSRENEAWNHAIERTISSTEDSKAKKRLKDQVKTWLNPKVFTEQAKTKVLHETMMQLSEWLGKRGAVLDSDQEKSIWLAAAGSVRALAKSIASVPTVTREDLERIVAEWLPGAVSRESRPPELGGPLRLGSPGHLLDSVDHLVWWQPHEKSITRVPWTTAEIAWLANNGVKFPDHDLFAKAGQARANRVILNTRKTLTLFHCPQNEAMDSVLSPLAVRMAAEFGSSIVLASETLIETEPVEVKPLASRRPSWQISCPERLTARENESFSSLAKFIYSPWEWVLNYKARLRASPQVDFRIVDDARRQGSLLHGFVESLLEPEPDPFETENGSVPDAGKSNESESTTAGLLDTLVRRLFAEDSSISWKDISQNAVIEWVESHWENILAGQAAHYLVPGNEASRSELLYLAKNAIWELLQQLRAADIVSVFCEEKIADVPFCGGKLGGFIDLRVVKKDGAVGLIDLKLGGLSYRREELFKGRHLQLAIYGYLVKAKYGKEANCAYFIFSGGGKMLARTKSFFPLAEVVFPKAGSPEEEWKDCWAGFERLWKVRDAQLKAGTIELETSFDLGLWSVDDPSKFSDFLNLAGWAKTD